MIGQVEAERLLVGRELVLVRSDLVGVLRVGRVHLGDGVVVGLLRARYVVLELRDLVLRQRSQDRLQVRLGGGEVGGRLIDRCLLRARVDGGELLAGRHMVSDVHVDLGQRAGDLEVDVGLELRLDVTGAADACGHRAPDDRVQVQRARGVLARHEHVAVDQRAEDQGNDGQACHHSNGR